ncbi:hypothetical protein [Pseudohongiella sp.]|uniref:Fibronectin type-III domain-containing protein n=1 Tax=marine sediment metagenome TaxID=412755 RepID=A0A0F9W3N2_9ZZZZ|nr:hypothetical protein [Pseudohongiella sp.]HDZ09598.1 hypothetical protein [Pseudohongiella sp.]HEA62512.1 hypothetical protein [Pseudohongiella sp.]
MLNSKYVATCVSLVVTMLPPIVSAVPGTGGFLETPDNAAVRPVLDSNTIQSFMPARGAFTFPAPYNTQAVRLTNGSDCAGQDCVNYAGYSYWRNMNNHVGMESMLIFLGLDQNRGGRGPSLLELNKNTGEVKDLGALFPSNNPLSWATGEGWYFSATMPTKLYINDGPSIVRLDVITGQMQTVTDITDTLGSGHYLSQIHSSDNDRVHSATVRESKSYKALGCMAYEEDSKRFHYYPIASDYDECQVDRSGKWLLIKANLDGQQGEDNLVVELSTGNERILLDSDGAAGHSDLGHGYMIAADNWANDANTWKLWDFSQSSLKGERVYHNNDWNVSAPNHLSHTNARPDLAARDQYACGSSASQRAGPHANEIICFNLDGRESNLVVAPVMTDLNATGGGDTYAKAPKGNLDVTGRYFFWTSNMGGSRLDAFIVQVPDHLLTGNVDYSPAPTSEEPLIEVPGPVTVPPLSPVDPITAGPVLWHDIRNVTIEGEQLTKTSGCNGCDDAGVISVQSVTTGNATFDFTANATAPILFAGFTSTQEIASANGFEFSVRLQQGIAEVRERGIYRADTRFAAGDHFRILVDGGKVEYLVNDTVFYTSTAPASYPLFAGVTFNTTGAAVNNLRLGVEQSLQVSEPVIVPPLLTVDTIPAGSIFWSDISNVAIEGEELTKTSGCNGCDDAGVISLQSVTTGNAAFDFTANASAPMLIAGLTSKQEIASAKGFKFGLRLQQGIAEVRERGIYRADTRFAAGDRFRILVEGGKVQYLVNDVVFYTSKMSASYPLFAGVTFNTTGAAVKNLRFDVGQSPQLSSLVVYHKNPDELEVNWVTDRPSESMVQYGLSAQYGTDSDLNAVLSENHLTVLRDLIPGETYHFRALNRDAEGRVSSSEDLVVTLPM